MLKQILWPTGRTRCLVYWIVLLPVDLAMTALDRAIPHPTRDQAIVLSVLSLGASYLMVSLFVGRLHDLDRTGWWAVLLSALLAPLGLRGANFDLPKEFALPILVATCAGVFSTVYLGLYRGTRGPNRFGPDPLGSDVSHVNGQASTRSDI
jgi:uncharacterized membrane protein YhaH (DUF805 family)